MLPLSSIRAITLLMTSATSSLALSPHKMFLSSQLSYHGAFPNTKRSQCCDFYFFFIQVMTLALIHMEPLSFQDLFWKQRLAAGPVAMAFINSYHLDQNCSCIWHSSRPLASAKQPWSDWLEGFILSRSFIFQPSITFNLTLKTCLASASLRFQPCLIPTALTASFVRDEVIRFFSPLC